MLSNETHLFAHCEVTGADVIVILETIPNIVAGIAARQGWYPEILMFVFRRDRYVLLRDAISVFC